MHINFIQIYSLLYITGLNFYVLGRSSGNLNRTDFSAYVEYYKAILVSIMETVGIFIGRFQPLHNAHLHIIKEALLDVDHLLLFIGSAGRPEQLALY